MLEKSRSHSGVHHRKRKLQCGNDRTCDLHGDRCQSDRGSASGEC